MFDRRHAHGPFAAALTEHRQLLLAVTLAEVLHVDRVAPCAKVSSAGDYRTTAGAFADERLDTPAGSRYLVATSDNASTFDQRLTRKPAISLSSRPTADGPLLDIHGASALLTERILSGRILSRNEHASVRFNLAFSTPNALQTAGLRHSYPAITGFPVKKIDEL